MMNRKTKRQKAIDMQDLAFRRAFKVLKRLEEFIKQKSSEAEKARGK